MATSSDQPTSVNAIFARAERVFERRVDQLLLAKRAKAAAQGTPFNARKAKRDARTVAGREKLDALVRRLADLAIAQEAALNSQAHQNVNHSLQGAAAAIVAISASLSENQIEHPSTISCIQPTEEIVDDTPKSNNNNIHRNNDFSNPTPDSTKDLFDTSSCSDDCYDVVPVVPAMKEIRDVSDNDDKDPLPPSTSLPHTNTRYGIRYGNNNIDYVANSHITALSTATPNSATTTNHNISHLHTSAQVPRCTSAPVSHAPLFEATESVVNFVLECDDDEHEQNNLVKTPAAVTHDVTSAREYINAMESARAVAQSQWHSNADEYAASY